MSSVASVSSCRATASRVAVRRGSAIRDKACARATWAYRASVATRPGGTADRSSPPTPSWRTSLNRSRAPSNPAAVTLVGPRRSRSSREVRVVSSMVSSPFRWWRCSSSGSAARSVCSCWVAWPRTVVMSRSSRLGPGSSTLFSMRRAVARSNSTLGRSAVVRARAVSHPVSSACTAGSEKSR
jgi:hypothetical protein